MNGTVKKETRLYVNIDWKAVPNNNLRWIDAKPDVKRRGMHTLKVCMIDPKVVLENIVINPNNKYPSYFGAPALIN